MVGSEQPNSEVRCYEDVFGIEKLGVVNKVKMKVVQAMIQVERPINWSVENVEKLIKEISSVELYNAAVLGKVEEAKQKWGTIVK